MSLPAAKRARTSHPLTARRVADRLESTLRQSIRWAIDQVRARASDDLLESAARDQSGAGVQRILDAFPSVLQGAQRIQERAYLTSAELAADVLTQQLRPRKAPRAQVTVTFNAANPRAVHWTRRAAALLVRQLTEESREAVRQIIREAIEDGITAAQTARRLRDVIGLTDGQALAVVTYERQLRAAGKPESTIDRLGSKYADKLLRYRTEVIARTEIIQASNQGQRELWRQARDKGLIDDGAQREWITTTDDRLCEVCAPMDGQLAPLDGEFVSMDGTAETPPIHPSCRCAQGLKFS